MKPLVTGCLAIVFWLFANSAHAQQPTPMSCTESPIAVPFTFPFKCTNAGQDHGGKAGGLCAFDTFYAAGGDQTRGFLAIGFRIAPSVRDRCWVSGLGQDIAEALKHTDIWVRQNGADFAAVQTFGDGFGSTFTGTGERGPLPCFSFFKYGPKHLTGYENTIGGHVCNRDGSSVTVSEMQQFIQAAGVR